VIEFNNRQISWRRESEVNSVLSLIEV